MDSMKNSCENKKRNELQNVIAYIIKNVQIYKSM